MNSQELCQQLHYNVHSTSSSSLPPLFSLHLFPSSSPSLTSNRSQAQWPKVFGHPNIKTSYMRVWCCGRWCRAEVRLTVCLVLICSCFIWIYMDLLGVCQMLLTCRIWRMCSSCSPPSNMKCLVPVVNLICILASCGLFLAPQMDEPADWFPCVSHLVPAGGAHQPALTCVRTYSYTDDTQIYISVLLHLTDINI